MLITNFKILPCSQSLFPFLMYSVFITGVFVNMFFIAYMLSPRFCHRFVGYLEEEAVKTYTYCIEVSM